MTRQEAREYFKAKGLTYADISRTDVALLGTFLNRSFAKARAEAIAAGDEPYWVRVNSGYHYRGGFGEGTGAMLWAYLTGKGGHFAVMEVVSFNRGGRINFCSDASDKNTQPVLEAFVEWCDELAAQKELTKEVGP